VTGDSGKVVVFVTTSSEEEAEKIASLLLEQRKAACVSVIPESDPGSGGRGSWIRHRNPC